MKVLHLSDTTLSGSPYRLSGILNKYTEVESRHMVWFPVMQDRVFPCDLVGSLMKREELQQWFDWADIVHYHNRTARLEIFKKIKFKKKPSVVQIHSPRLSEDFTPEIKSKIPIAVIAQYHPREWEKEMSYMVPNMVDIYDGIHTANPKKYENNVPVVGYSPSNSNAKGWDDKGYGQTHKLLKKLWILEKSIVYEYIIKKPFLMAMAGKRTCNIGIDEFVTGSYHMSSLEFLATGCATIAQLDDKTQACIKHVTGAPELPWVNIKPHEFETTMRYLIKSGDHVELGKDSRHWMERYYDPKKLCQHYLEMYAKL